MRQSSIRNSFELSLDGGLVENTPLGMVQYAKFPANHWKYSGTKIVTGYESGEFCLIKIPQASSLEEVIKRTKIEGFEIPAGQWLKAYLDKKPRLGLGSIGVADPSWKFPSGQACFPFLSLATGLDFHNQEISLKGDWTWLVKIPN